MIFIFSANKKWKTTIDITHNSSSCPHPHVHSIDGEYWCCSTLLRRRRLLLHFARLPHPSLTRSVVECVSGLQLLTVLMMIVAVGGAAVMKAAHQPSPILIQSEKGEGVGSGLNPIYTRIAFFLILVLSGWTWSWKSVVIAKLGPRYKKAEEKGEWKVKSSSKMKIFELLNRCYQKTWRVKKTWRIRMTMSNGMASSASVDHFSIFHAFLLLVGSEKSAKVAGFIAQVIICNSSCRLEI